MYELCALLRQSKIAKPRKPRGPTIKPGCACTVWGTPGTVVGKTVDKPGCWDVLALGKVSWWRRDAIDVVDDKKS